MAFHLDTRIMTYLQYFVISCLCKSRLWAERSGWCRWLDNRFALYRRYCECGGYL